MFRISPAHLLTNALLAINISKSLEATWSVAAAKNCKTWESSTKYLQMRCCKILYKPCQKQKIETKGILHKTEGNTKLGRQEAKIVARLFQDGGY